MWVIECDLFGCTLIQSIVGKTASEIWRIAKFSTHLGHQNAVLGFTLVHSIKSDGEIALEIRPV